MSWQVIAIRILSSKDFSLSLDKMASLAEALERNLPEDHLLYEDSTCYGSTCYGGVIREGRAYPATQLTWYGEGSGSTFRVLRDRVLPEFDGEADLLVVDDNGGMAGYRVRDHKVTEHEVCVSLGALVQG